MAESVPGQELQARAEQQPQNKDTVTVLDWNVWHKANPDAVLSHLKDVMQQYRDEFGSDVDVIQLQEFTGELAQRFAEELGMDHYVVSPARHLQFAGRDYGKGDDLIILSKRPLENEEKQKLVEGGWLFGFREKPSVQANNYLQADLPLADGQALRLANVHKLPPRVTSWFARRKEGLKLADIASMNSEKPYMLSGDFNAGPRGFAARKLRPLLRPVRKPGTATWTGKHWKSMGPLGRFIRREYDQTYVSKAVRVLSSKVYDGGPSDHKPSITTVKVLPQPS